MSLFSVFVSIYVRRSRLVLLNIQVHMKQKWAEDKMWVLLEDEICTADLIRFQLYRKLNSRGNRQGQEVWIWKEQHAILITRIDIITFCALSFREKKNISNLHVMCRNFMVCIIMETPENVEASGFIWPRSLSRRKEVNTEEDFHYVEDLED